jgi:carbon-monoxide dehydrogenase medium subunit
MGSTVNFEVLEPESLAEAVSLLGANAEATKVIAGGQSLLLMIRSGLLMPGFLLSLNSLCELNEVRTTSEHGLSIGALVTHRQVLASREIAEKVNILQQAVDRIGSTPVRNFGTLVGNLCHNEMGSDPPAALLALDAAVECVSASGRRRVPLGEFFTDYFETSLQPDEILASIEIPCPTAALHGVYLKHRFRAGDLALVGVATLISVREGVCEEIKLALSGVGAVPFRVLEAENLLRRRNLNNTAIDEAAACAAAASDPITDAHVSADYRRKMVRVFVKRALQQAIKGAEKR